MRCWQQRCTGLASNGRPAKMMGGDTVASSASFCMLGPPSVHRSPPPFPPPPPPLSGAWGHRLHLCNGGGN